MGKSATADIALQRFNLFDGILHKRGTFVDKQFPPHLHHEWSLSLIETGCEWLTTENREVSLHAGSLVLIPPDVIHANRGNPGSYWQYGSLYINPQAMEFIARRHGIDSATLRRVGCHIAYDPALVQWFKGIADGTVSGALQESAVQTLCAAVLKNAVSSGGVRETAAQADSIYADCMHYLQTRFREKHTLEHLSLMYAQNKYAFLRRFRAVTGLTPQDYIMALRVEASKKRLMENDSLTEVALESGFYDQSHFTHVFGKYVGITPGAYKARCNILQDKANVPG